MSGRLHCRIDNFLKSEYDSYIQTEFGYKRNIYGSELEKAMKFYLAANGNKLYQNDPDVIDLIDTVQKKFKQNSPSKTKADNTLEEKLDKMEKKFEEKFEFLAKKLEQKSKRESSKKHGLAEFKKQFQMAFNNYHQVSKREVESFIMNQSDIVDNRSIKSRIQYLESHGILKSFAPNVYDVNISKLF